MGLNRSSARRRVWVAAALAVTVTAGAAVASVIDNDAPEDDGAADITSPAESTPPANGGTSVPIIDPGGSQPPDATSADGDQPATPTSTTPTAPEPVPEGSSNAPTDSGAGTPTAAAGSFVETFDGAPPAPEPWKPTNWDVTVHSRDISPWTQLDPMPAAHSDECGAPPTTHELSSYDDAVYRCRDHVMTAINAGGYAMIYLTPNQMVDFSGGEAVISVDVSTFRSSTRDWWDIWITPFEDNLQLPLELGSDVDVAGPPRNSVHVTLGTENQMKAEIRRDFESIMFPDWPNEFVTGDTFTGYETFLTPDMARRDTFEIRISKTHLKVGMPDYDFWWIDTEIPDLGWDRGVIQFGHHSYNPTKDCNTVNNPKPPVTECLPNTWHWDDIVISNATPFTIIRSDQRAVTKTSPTVTFDGPAPADAFLRFAGTGSDLQVRFDDGEWQPAVPQATARPTAPEHFASYWQPIPAGTAQVSFRGTGVLSNEWHARDITIWSESPGA